MNLNWMNSLIYGLISGLTDILPASSLAHQGLLLKLYGIQGNMEVMDLMVHLGILVALYYNTQSQLLRMSRARAQARIPKNKRKRPLDVHSLMDWSLLKTMAVPAIAGLYLYRYARNLEGNMILLAILLFGNGVILYLPQFFPTSNRDARTLSRVEGLLMGLGAAVGVIPGISGLGAVTTVGSLCGVERKFALDMAMLMNLLLTVGRLLYDVAAISAKGMGTISFLILLRYLLTGGAAFAGTVAGIRLMYYFAQQKGYTQVGVYCWGLALFTFILNLVA